MRIAWTRQPFDTKPVSGGRARSRRSREERGTAVLRHAVDESTEVLHVALPGRVSTRAPEPKHNRTLEDRMVEYVTTAARSTASAPAGPITRSDTAARGRAR